VFIISNLVAGLHVLHTSSERLGLVVASVTYDSKWPELKMRKQLKQI